MQVFLTFFLLSPSLGRAGEGFYPLTITSRDFRKPKIIGLGYFGYNEIAVPLQPKILTIK